MDDAACDGRVRDYAEGVIAGSNAVDDLMLYGNTRPSELESVSLAELNGTKLLVHRDVPVVTGDAILDAHGISLM